MKITIEIRIDQNYDGWCLRIDGHEWTCGLSGLELDREIQRHVTATLHCLEAEVAA